MSDKDNEESAFPCTDARRFVETGITLRDWFAGQWLAGAAADPGFGWSECEIPVLCQKAYEVADTMMEVSKK